MKYSKNRNLFFHISLVGLALFPLSTLPQSLVCKWFYSTLRNFCTKICSSWHLMVPNTNIEKKCVKLVHWTLNKLNFLQFFCRVLEVFILLCITSNIFFLVLSFKFLLFWNRIPKRCAHVIWPTTLVPIILSSPSDTDETKTIFYRTHRHRNPF